MKLLRAHEGFWTPERKHSFYLGVIFLLLALIFQFGAAQHSFRYAAQNNFVGDLFLDNLPVVNLDFIIVQGAVLLWTGVAMLLILRPKYLLFGMKAIALFIVIRSLFINLTHVGIYPHQAVFDPTDFGYSVYGLVAFQGNYFFSGHTGLPYLMALVFWRDRFWRYFFLVVSAIFAVSVLLAHVHYSIDVFAAPFISFGIFHLAKELFPKDFALVEDKVN